MTSALTGESFGSAKPFERSPIKTGLHEFDEALDGIPPQSLTILYGHHKGGKTTLTMNLAEHVAVEEKRPVLYLVQSFNAQTLLGQIVSSRAQVDWLDVAEGKLTAEETGRLDVARGEVAGASLVVEDTPHLADGEIVERIEAWADKHPGGLAIVDHLVRDTPRDIDRCSHALKTAAVRTGAAVIATSRFAPIWDDERLVTGVGLSHADFDWQLLRWWCHSENLYPRDAVHLNISDQRTGEHRLALDLRLDEKFRRLSVVAMKSSGLSSLREERLKHPRGTVYHRILKPGEEPPPGYRKVYVSGLDPALDLGIWESSSWYV
jgi:KaiC/GvpD/RAD55 family RecA-like ATPase